MTLENFKSLLPGNVITFSTTLCWRVSNVTEEIIELTELATGITKTIRFDKIDGNDYLAKYIANCNVLMPLTHDLLNELKLVDADIKDVEFDKDFVFVKGGTFQMGSETGDSDEQPVHSVTLSDFYMCDHTVTQAEWEAIMGNNPSYFKGDDRPVESVSWDDAQEYIKKLNANTYIVPSAHLQQNNNSVSVYSRTQPTNTFAYSGVWNPNFVHGYGSSGGVIEVWQNTTSLSNISTNYTSFITAVRRGSGTADAVEIYKAGVSIRTDTYSSQALQANNYYLGAVNNNGTTQWYTTVNMAFASLGESLTDVEATNYYTAVQAFQTTLGRQV